MSNVQKLKVDLDSNNRVETGAVEFEYNGGRKDWRGVFIRGDNAFYLALQLEKAVQILEEQPDCDVLMLAQIQDLIDIIRDDVIEKPKPKD